MVKEHSLKFLIAFKQPDTNILPLVERFKQKKSPQLNSSFTTHKLTALHMAVMKNRPEVAKALLKAGANPNTRDQYGWTPLHHAALVSDELTQILLGAGASKDAQTNLGGAYQDLKYLSGREVAVYTGDRIFYRDEVSGEVKISKISVEKFQELTGLSLYSDEPIFPPDQLKKLWISLPKKLSHDDLFRLKQITAAYQQFRKNPSHLILGKDPVFVQTLGEGKNAQTYGVYAKKQIKFGDFIVEYTGKVIEKGKGVVQEGAFRNEYVLGKLDARKVGNLSRFINDGFPNAAFIPLRNFRGCQTRSGIVCFQEAGIAPKEQVFLDYGLDLLPLKWGRYVISNKKEILQFFGRELQGSSRKRKGLGAKLQTNNRKCNFNANNLLNLSGLTCRIMFPLTSPAVLIFLTFTKTVDLQFWKDFLKEDVVSQQKKHHVDHYTWIENLISLLEDVESQFDKLEKTGEEGQRVVKQMREFILEQLDELKVTQVVKGIYDIREVLRVINRMSATNNDFVPEKDWIDLCQRLKTTLPSYDVYRDDRFVLNFAQETEKQEELFDQFMKELQENPFALMTKYGGVK